MVDQVTTLRTLHPRVDPAVQSRGPQLAAPQIKLAVSGQALLQNETYSRHSAELHL